MWLGLAFMSALLLGCYDMAKKTSLKGNAVIPVLFLNTLFCSIIFIPFVCGSFCGLISGDSYLYTSWSGWESQRWIILKSFIVLSSWMLGYFGIKDLPLTIVGPINATRPVMTLVGAMLIFGERLNGWQWAGVTLAIVSLYLLSLTSKKEGVDFRRDKSVFLVVLAAVLGAMSGLYDKFLMADVNAGGLGLNRMEVQAWYNIYQCVWMLLVLLLVWIPKRADKEVFHWSWTIVLISIFLVGADFAYFYSLSQEGAMVSIVSMVRRSNVIVSFIGGVFILGERNWRHKAFDLFLVAVSMFFIWLGTR